MSDPYKKISNIYAHTSVPWQQDILNNFLTSIDTHQIASCLDVGTGIGNNIATLKKYCLNINAIDISGRSLRILRDRYRDLNGRITISEGDVASLPYPNVNFELVVCTEMLEHCINPKEIIKECYRVLKPAGYLIVSGPNYYNLAGLVKLVHERLSPHSVWDAWGNHAEGRENFSTSLGLKKLIKDSGTVILQDRGGDIIRSWLPFLRKHYAIIDRHPFLSIGKRWPFKLIMMNYFIIGQKPINSRL